MKRKILAILLSLSLSGCAATETNQYTTAESDLIDSLQAKGTYNYTIVDESEITYELLNEREIGHTLVSRCIGEVVDAQKGDGRIINHMEEGSDYISYRSLRETENLSDGMTIVTYLVYNPETNVFDDITERYDYIVEGKGKK